MTNKLIFGEAAHSCSCIGPQNGQPYCPCQMRAFGVYERGGRWVQPERDLGPVQPMWKEEVDFAFRDAGDSHE